MNVLVYAGSEVNQKSLNNTVDLLRSVCLPNYTVQTLSKASFAKEPWEVACALLVLPALNNPVLNSDLQIFTPKEVQRIREYVEREGGAFLGLGLGVRFEEHVSLDTAMAKLHLGLGTHIRDEDRREPLKFLDPGSKITIYPLTGGSIVPSEPVALVGAEETTLVSQSTDATFPQTTKKLDVLATSPSGTAAGRISVGKGHLVLAKFTLGSDPNDSIFPLIRIVLDSLTLQLPPAPLSPANLSPLPQFLTSIPPHSNARAKPIVSLILSPFFSNSTASSFLFGHIRDTADTFKVAALNSEWANDALGKNDPPVFPESENKHIIVCPDGILPPRDCTPRFDLQLYYDTLRKLKGLDASPDSGGWGIGEALLYSERVTSTQSMFDKNPILLSTMPTPILSIAAQQLSGRGRGKNVWLSPEGCLMMSLLVRVDLDPGGRGTATASAKTGKTSTNDPRLNAKTTKTEGGDASSSKTSNSATNTAKTTTAAGGGDALETAPAETTGFLKTASATPETKTTKTTGRSDGELKMDAEAKTLKTTSTGCDQLKTNATNFEPSAKTNVTETSDANSNSTDTGTKPSQTKSSESGPNLKLASSGHPGPGLIFQRLAMAPNRTEPPKDNGPPNPIPILSASKLVFIQYLFALAVCEACRLPEVLGPELGKKVRIKWPNDLYLDLSEPGEPSKKNLKKIGGILVNTNFAPGGKVDVVIGCGLNVLNIPPIASLAQLQATTNSTVHPLSMERTAAAIMSTFERLWMGFTESSGSFEPFLSSYYDVWLHTDQRVTVTTTVPPTNTRIVGITPNYGLLRTVRDDASGQDERSGTSYGRYVYSAYEGGRSYIDLQPDGNSFDLMANLIKAKTT